MSSDLSTDPLPASAYGPSEVRAAAPALARGVGFFGLMAVTVGVVSVIAAQYGRGLLSEPLGYLAAAVGLTALFVHAAADGDEEVRRMYGLFAGLVLFAAVGASLLPAGPDRRVGHLLLPWGGLGGLVALLFLVPFARHETDEPYARYVRLVLLVAGGLLTVGSVAAGLIAPQTLVGPGVLLALLGLGYVAAFLGTVDTGTGAGYRAAAALGTVGGAAFLMAVGLSVVPAVLHDGPAALRTPLQTYDFWKVLARVLTTLGCLGVAGWGAYGRLPTWLRGPLVVVGLSAAGVFVAGSVFAPLTQPPRPYLVPTGLLLGGIGLAYLAVAVGVTSDAPLVVLTRRELAAYFYSPIAYIVLLVNAFACGIGYMLFLWFHSSRGGLEPIVQDYYAGTLIGPLTVPFLVPALTMRLLSEERRTGTLEVLLTAPVSEWAVVTAKFLGAWAYFVLCWVPAGLYLIGLRVEGAEEFDYRPLLSFYLTVAVTGAALVAIGLVFSAVTSNQLVAAVLTFGAALALMTAQWAKFMPIGPGLRAAVERLSYWTLWEQSLRGQLPVGDILIQGSVAVFGVFLAVRILEARKWT